MYYICIAERYNQQFCAYHMSVVNKSRAKSIKNIIKILPRFITEVHEYSELHNCITKMPQNVHLLFTVTSSLLYITSVYASVT